MIKKLTEYKELIAILVFFLGGFFWLNKQFPTKDDLTAEKEDLKAEIASLNCLLDKYMFLTQRQIRSQELAKEAQNLANRISEIEADRAGMTLSPAMKFELTQLNSEFEHNREEHRRNKDEIKKILDELARDVCRKVQQ